MSRIPQRFAESNSPARNELNSDAASSDSEEEELGSIQERQLGPTLLDNLIQLTGYTKKAFVASHFVFITKLRDSAEESKKLFTGNFEKLVESLQKDKFSVHINGCVLVYESCCLVALELSANALTPILQYLNECHTRGWFQKTSKVLMNNEAKQSTFASLTVRILQGDSTRPPEEFNTKDSDALEVASECVNIMIDLGLSITALQDTDEDWELQANFPSENMVEFLLKQKEVESFTEHFQRQTRNLDLVLEGEVTWPMAERVYPYD